MRTRLRYQSTTPHPTRRYPPSSIGEGTWFYLTDVQFSVVAVLTDIASQAPRGVAERVKYDGLPASGGRARHRWFSDLDGDGDSDIDDYNAQVAAASTSIHGTNYRPDADHDRDGDVDGNDLFAFLGGAGQAALDEGLISDPLGPDNPIGYDSYVFSPEAGLNAPAGSPQKQTLGAYCVRFRWYLPETGRWLQRDPAGYVDGMGLHGFVRSSPLAFLDSLGLRAAPPTNRQVTIVVRIDAPPSGSRFDPKAVCANLQAIVDQCNFVPPVRVQCYQQDPNSPPDDLGFEYSEPTLLESSVWAWVAGAVPGGFIPVAAEEIGARRRRYLTSYTHHVTWSRTPRKTGASPIAVNGGNVMQIWWERLKEELPGSAGTEEFAQAYANIIAHEMLWHGILDRYDLGRQDELAATDLRRSENQPRDVPCSIDSELCDQLGEQLGVSSEPPEHGTGGGG